MDRANEHLQQLDREWRGYLNTEPFVIRDEFDAGTGRHVLRLRIRESPGFRFSLIVGDLIYNVRSALDQAAWLVACRSNPIKDLWDPKVARCISFPVTNSRREFRKHRIQPHIADDAREALESLQPYNDGETPAALKQLDFFWNVDKHRVLHGALVQLDVAAVRFTPKSIYLGDIEAVERVNFAVPEQIGDGTEIASFRFPHDRPPPASHIAVTGTPKASIAFGGGGIGVALPIMRLAALIGHGGAAIDALRSLPEKPA